MKENKYDSLLQAGFEIFELIEPQPNEVMLNTIPEMNYLLLFSVFKVET